MKRMLSILVLAGVAFSGALIGCEDEIETESTVETVPTVTEQDTIVTP